MHSEITASDHQKALQSFYRLLKKMKSEYVFNPWSDVDPDNDVDRAAPKIRFKNLKNYIGERKNAEYLLLAEAIGYQGGHFTGIPMTSERILLGKRTDAGIQPDHVCRSRLRRTSHPKINANGFNEPTATIVWQKLIDENLDTRNFILWNAFAWHPFNGAKGYLSNRTPKTSEMAMGEPALKAFLKSFRFAKVIALGNKAQYALKQLGVDAVKVRHPAMGGARLFRQQLVKLL